jgi:hypothetical protein
MPRVCTVYHHLRRKEVDRDLLAGMPLRTIADHWSVSKTALIRHKTDHLASALVKAKDAEGTGPSRPLVQEANLTTHPWVTVHEAQQRVLVSFVCGQPNYERFVREKRVTLLGSE